MSEEVSELARRALGPERAWLVGGVVRDRLLGRATPDVDIVVEGDPRGPAHALADASGGVAFALSEAFGAWRVVGPGQRWQVDLSPLRGEGGIEADLAQRDFTINALAEPLAGGPLVDPFGGAEDLASKRLRIVAPSAFEQDPLRVLRLPRLACELALESEQTTVTAARDQAVGLEAVAPERIWAELRRIIRADRVLEGLDLMAQVGATAVVLPEVQALHGIEQTRYHHLDVHDHTFAVLGEVVALELDPGHAAQVLGSNAAGTAAVLAEPLADDLTRAEALRLGALLHDVAKPRTRVQLSTGRVGFPGHDRAGAEMSAAILRRLRASTRVVDYVAALARHHLRLGFLVHERPLGRRAVYRYLRTCEPVEVDVSVLSVADRLATRGRKADVAIAEHLDLAQELLSEALAWRADGAPTPIVRGDELAAAIGLTPGPRLGELLDEVEEAAWAGEIETREQAIERARALLAG